MFYPSPGIPSMIIHLTIFLLMCCCHFKNLINSLMVPTRLSNRWIDMSLSHPVRIKHGIKFIIVQYSNISKLGSPYFPVEQVFTELVLLSRTTWVDSGPEVPHIQYRSIYMFQSNANWVIELNILLH